MPSKIKFSAVAFPISTVISVLKNTILVDCSDACRYVDDMLEHMTGERPSGLTDQALRQERIRLRALCVNYLIEQHIGLAEAVTEMPSMSQLHSWLIHMSDTYGKFIDIYPLSARSPTTKPQPSVISHARDARKDLN